MYNFNLAKDFFSTTVKKIKGKSAAGFSFAHNPNLQKWAILLSLSLILAVFLTPRIYYKYPAYPLGAIAGSNVKADRDFLVEKKPATDQKIMEAMNDVQSVYDYDSEMESQIQASVTNAFLLIKESDGEKVKTPTANPPPDVNTHLRQVKKDVENIIGVTLTADEFNTLYRNKFAASIASDITKLLAFVYHNEMITNVSFLQQEKDKGIIIRDVRSQSETELKKLSQIMHITDMETILTKRAGKLTDINKPEIRKVAISLTIKLIHPNLTLNKNATELRRQEAIKDVKPVFFKVQKNEMLVREGEKISAAVMDKLDSYYRIKGAKKLSGFFVFMGTFLMIAFLIVVLYYPSKNWLKYGNVDLLFLSIIVILQVLLVRAGIFIAEAVTDAFPLFPSGAFIYSIPFAVGAMLTSLLINRNLSFMLAVFLSLIIASLFDGKMSLFLFSFLGSAVASYRIVDCKQRTAFLKIGIVLGLVNGATIIFLKLLSDTLLSFDTLISLIMGLSGGVVSGILVAGLMPVFESLFHYTTDIKLLELANLNQPIFQRMIIETPGTYHHSIVVASMVEAAAEAIKANSLLAKVSAYYHDIGKMKKPQYFIENQQNGDNKHDKLTPKMSSLVIISHIKDGCDLANKVKLGAEITNIIREHHGTSLVSFFYEKAKKDKDPSIRLLPESDFRYPGPKPQTREAGLVLLGDVVEASSRSLSNPTPSRIRSLVRERIERVFADGQLDDCELTLRDLNNIAESFNLILNGIFHHRIDYPGPVIRGMEKENNGTPDKKQTEKNKDRFAVVTAIGE